MIKHPQVAKIEVSKKQQQLQQSINQGSTIMGKSFKHSSASPVKNAKPQTQQDSAGKTVTIFPKSING